MDYIQAGPFQGLYIQQVGQIVGDDATVGRPARQHFFQPNKTRVRWYRTHGLIPSSNVTAFQTDHHVHLLLEGTKLVYPGFMAIEDKQTIPLARVVHLLIMSLAAWQRPARHAGPYGFTYSWPCGVGLS